MFDWVSVNTSSLTGKALDWSVAYALNGTPLLDKAFPDMKIGDSFLYAVNNGIIKPTTDWSQCGELIDYEGIEFRWLSDAVVEAYSHTMSENRARGNDHREAACRLIALELGETVMVPAELVVQSSR
ncbi:hypothetical protein D3C77_28810 [compost metagenome]